tara:strand:+ start:262 stop:1083 length:822 start_codon:yes stop_codon:yes gene_type:complete
MALRNKIYSKAKKRNYSNFFLSFLFILTFLLILFNKTDHIIISKLKNFGLDVVNPITRIVSFPALVINNAALKINNIQNLEIENFKLKEEIIRLKQWQTLAIKNSRENRVFKRILNSTSNEVEIIKTASVINHAGNFYKKIVTINAGLNSNIKKDLAVINEKGLVGKVILTSKNNSKILLINDQSSSVPVKTLSDKSFSILSGTSDGRYLISSFIKDTKMPKVGDLLVTSGNAKIFPRDILVAKVVKVNLDHYLAIPYVDFKNLSYIQVINSK